MQDIVLFLQNHLLLSCGFIGAFSLLMVLEYIKQKGSTTEVSPAQLTLLINREDATVIDLRPAAQFAQGHIINAVSLPHAELASSAKKLDKLKSKPLVLVCGVGTDSAKVAPSLRATHPDLRILQGGIAAWRKADMPIVKD